MIQTDDGRWTVVGVTSFSAGCARKDRPDVYANVAYMSDWIWSTVKANGG